MRNTHALRRRQRVSENVKVGLMALKRFITTLHIKCHCTMLSKCRSLHVDVIEGVEAVRLNALLLIHGCKGYIGEAKA